MIVVKTAILKITKINPLRARVVKTLSPFAGVSSSHPDHSLWDSWWKNRSRGQAFNFIPLLSHLSPHPSSLVSMGSSDGEWGQVKRNFPLSWAFIVTRQWAGSQIRCIIIWKPTKKWQTKDYLSFSVIYPPPSRTYIPGTYKPNARALHREIRTSVDRSNGDFTMHCWRTRGMERTA